MSDFPFDTLIAANGKKYSERWHPSHSIDAYKAAFILNGTYEETEALRKNLAYSMQYLEYLEKQLAELTLHSVVEKMVIKTYVITATSVIEGIFTNIVKTNGWWKTSQYESLGTTQANETNFDGQKFVVKTELLKKVDPYPLRMTLNDLIDILNRHHKALEVDHLVYPALKRLKDSRNRVHLQKVASTTDHDYSAFTDAIKKETGGILLQILSSPMVTNDPSLFSFLNVNLDSVSTETVETDMSE